jgi:hypothetical protein
MGAASPWSGSQAPALSLKIFFLAGAFALVLAPDLGAAAELFGVYLEPWVGGTWQQFKALEIDETFLKKNPDEELEKERFLEENKAAVVGTRATYQGSGPTFGASGGLRLSSLRIGVHLNWTLIHLEGYSKRYRYDPDALRARGRKYYDERDIDIQRILFELGYALPIGILELIFRSHVGGISFDSQSLVMGQAVESGRGLTGDIGVGLSLALASFLSAEIGGWFGFYAYTGKYDGAYGTLGGIVGTLTLKI